METVTTIDQFVNLLRSNPEIEFIGFVYTAWHVCAFEAALQMLEREKGYKLIGIVFIQKHEVAGYVIDDKFFSKRFDKIYKYEVGKGLLVSSVVIDRFKFIFKKMDSTNSLYVFSSGAPYMTMMCLLSNIFTNRNVISYLYDEGLSVYLQDSYTWFMTCIHQNTKVKKIIKFFILEFIVNKVSILVLKRRGVLKEQYLLKKNCGNWVPNEEIIPCFKKALFDSVNNPEISPLNFEEPYLIISTQVFSKEEDRQIKKILKRCIDIAINVGFNVVIKPHPRERIEDYENFNVEIIRYNDLSLEGMLEVAEKKPVSIMGIFSTTLVSCKLFHNIDTVSISPLVLNSVQLSPYERIIMRRFNNCFSDLVTLCGGYNMFEQYLIGIKRKKNA